MTDQEKVMSEEKAVVSSSRWTWFQHLQFFSPLPLQKCHALVSCL